VKISWPLRRILKSLRRKSKISRALRRIRESLRRKIFRAIREFLESYGYVWLKLAYMCFRDALFNGSSMTKLILPRFNKYEEVAAQVLGSAATGIQFLPPAHQVLLYLLSIPKVHSWVNKFGLAAFARQFLVPGWASQFAPIEVAGDAVLGSLHLKLIEPPPASPARTAASTNTHRAALAQLVAGMGFVIPVTSPLTPAYSQTSAARVSRPATIKKTALFTSSAKGDEILEVGVIQRKAAPVVVQVQASVVQSPFLLPAAMGLVMNSPPHTWYALIPSDCADAVSAGGSPSKSAFSRQAYISESLPPEALEVIHLGAVHLGVLPHLPIHP
jgi:hypothetical protein